MNLNPHSPNLWSPTYNKDTDTYAGKSQTFRKGPLKRSQMLQRGVIIQGQAEGTNTTGEK